MELALLIISACALGWGTVELDLLLERSQFLRSIRKILLQNKIDSRNLAAYGKIIGDYKATIHADSIDQPYISKFTNHLTKGSTILDYGCGSGGLTASLRNEGFMTHGSDISTDFILLAKNSHPDVTFLKADSKELVKSKLKFDAIIAAYSLIHLNDLMTAYVLSDFKKLLNKDGYLYLSLQNDNSEEAQESRIGSSGYCPVPYRQDVTLYLNVFTETEIRGELKEAGFEMIEVCYRDPVENEFPFRKMFVIAKAANIN